MPIIELEPDANGQMQEKSVTPSPGKRPTECAKEVSDEESRKEVQEALYQIVQAGLYNPY